MFIKKNKDKKESYIERKNSKRLTNAEFGINYLMSTMSDMNRRIANIERDVNELKQNGINISIDLDN